MTNTDAGLGLAVFKSDPWILGFDSVGPNDLKTEWKRFVVGLHYFQRQDE